MNRGRNANAPVRDWLDKSAKLPANSQKAKPTATVKPVQSNFPNDNLQPLIDLYRTLCTSPGVTEVRTNYPKVNKTNHQPPQNCAKSAAGPQKVPHRAHVPTSSGVKGNVASNSAVQININVQKNYYPSNCQKKPTTSAGSAPKACVARKSPAPASSGVGSNVASQNAVQLNVNVSSNVRNTRPSRSNNVQHAHNSAKPKLQCAAGSLHAPASQNKSSNSGAGHKRNVNSNKGNRTTVVIIHKN